MIFLCSLVITCRSENMEGDIHHNTNFLFWASISYINSLLLFFSTWLFKHSLQWQFLTSICVNLMLQVYWNIELSNKEHLSVTLRIIFGCNNLVNTLEGLELLSIFKVKVKIGLRIFLAVTTLWTLYTVHPLTYLNQI